MPKTEPVIEGKTLTLEEWLRLILSASRRQVFPNNCFPTDQMKMEYLSTVQTRNMAEVKRHLWCFLIENGTYGADCDRRERLLSSMEHKHASAERVLEYDFNRRLLYSRQPWQGNTWVLDLLPNNPNEALNALSAFFLAHFQIFPDNVFSGQCDAQSIIRTRFVDRLQPMDVLYSLTPRQFEVLIEQLYKKMGYVTRLTPQSRDGGKDIIAHYPERGRHEKLFVECKLWRNKVGEPIVDKLYGVVQRRHYSRGVIVCPGGFSGPARKAAKEVPVELIGGATLCRQLNKYLGSRWPKDLEVIVNGPRNIHRAYDQSNAD